MQFNQRKKRSGANAGYYLAALLCLVAVGLVVWTNVNQKKAEAEPETTGVVSAEDEAVSYEPLDAEMSELIDEEYHGDEFEELAVTASDATAQQISETAAPATTTAAMPKEMSVSADEAVEVSAQPVLYAKPVSGSILKEFSGDTLVYSTTMGDWRVHNGVDIACKDRCMVASAAKGKVISAGKDDRYGNVVIVQNSDDMMVYYCGLEDLTVREGDNVQPGQKLGVVGSIPCECEEEPHLHLMVMNDGDFLDPIKTLSLKY